MLAFDEPAWLKLLFLLSDTQSWINDMEKDLFARLPVTEKRNLFRKTYYLTAASLAHILERHYYKIARHPGTGKFTIPVPEIVHWIREARHQPVLPVPGSLNASRIFDTGLAIGFDQQGQSVTYLTIITNPAGLIITAFPGTVQLLTN